MALAEDYLYQNVVQSDDGAYRYLLRRQIADSGYHIMFVIHNPSLDDSDADPTTARIIDIARAWPGVGVVYIAGRFSLRRSDPDGLWDGTPTNTEDAIAAIRGCADHCNSVAHSLWSESDDAENPAGVVICWGAFESENGDALNAVSLTTAELMRWLINNDIEIDVMGYDPVSGSPLAPLETTDPVGTIPYE